MATDIIARGMITEYKSGTNIDFKENEDGSVTISASGDVSSEDTVARETIDNHKLNKNNPHNVTAEQIGLNNVNNTADLDKPISTAVQTALDKKVNKTDVQDNLESTDTTSPLSANQGRVLNEKITEHADNSDIHVTVTDKDNWNGYANEIETNKNDISTVKTDIQNLQDTASLNAKIIFSFNLQRTGKVYTVRFPLWETSQTCDGEKLDDNAGLVCNPSTAVTRGVSDYDNIPLFKTYDCNAYVDDNGVRHITALKGDVNFADVGKVDVFVLGMSYYEKWWEADGYVYYSRTDMPKEGYTLAAECRTKDGTDQGFALYGKYMVGDIDGMPYSSKGLVPARYCSGRPAGSQNISYGGNISYFHQRGAHYSGTFMSEIKYITTSWWLKYGIRNSQSIMAGCTDYNVGYTATVEETGVKRVIISNANAAYFEVGMPVSIGASTDRKAWAYHNKAESATITAIEVYDDNNKAIYVDVDTAFDTTTSTHISTFYWRSGFSDNVLGRDGCPCPTSAGLTNSKYPVVIQGIECFVGCYEVGSNVVMDIVDSTGKRDVYITNDSTKLTTDIDTIKSTYTKIAEQIVPTSVNDWNYITAVKCNVDNGIIVPTAAGQSGSSLATGYADGLYCKETDSMQREYLCFGRLDHGSVCGVSFLLADNHLKLMGWFIGTRLSING